MAIKRVYRKRPEPGWYYAYDLYIGGRRVRTPRGEYFPTKDECRDAVAAIRADHRRERYQFPADRSLLTLHDLRVAWIKRLKEGDRSHSYILSAERVLRSLSELLPGTNLIDVKTAGLRAYYSHRLAKGAKPQTVGRELVTIMGALNCASDLFPALAEWRPPRKPKSLSPSSLGRERIISREEESKIIAALMTPRERLSDFYARSRRQLARIFWIALRTGMREGEILGLHRATVNFDRAITTPNGWIEVRRSHGSDKTKTGKQRLIPMTAAVAELLKQQLEETSSVYVFPSPLDLQSRWASFRIGFRDACKAAGVPYGRETPDGLVFHDTRHTAATRMLHGGYDLKTVGTVLGHSDEYMTMKYAHSTASSRYAAVASIGEESFGVRFETVTSLDEPIQARPERDSARA